MRYLTHRVHARVGAARAVQADLGAEDFLQRRFERLLDRRAVRLRLPAAVVGAVVLDRELPSNHRGRGMWETG